MITLDNLLTCIINYNVLNIRINYYSFIRKNETFIKTLNSLCLSSYIFLWKNWRSWSLDSNFFFLLWIKLKFYYRITQLKIYIGILLNMPQYLQTQSFLDGSSGVGSFCKTFDDWTCWEIQLMKISNIKYYQISKWYSKILFIEG